MDRNVKLLLYPVICLAVFFGFAGALGAVEDWPFSVLHVFLFNLVSGGLLLLLHARGREGFGWLETVFVLCGLGFAAGAFFEVAPVNIGAALILAAVVESVRWKKFSWFPYEFFTNTPVSRKFEQASLLCLSLGLMIAAATIANNEYLKLIHFAKLDLHVFFLGFSFPISLVTYSLIFSRAESGGRDRSRALDEFCFWGLNLGVILFFVFIVLEVPVMQLLMALVLFATVWLTMYSHARSGLRGPEWSFLLSALWFLVVGSVTGIAYIIMLWKFEDYSFGYLLSLHSAANLFGWNLTWMMLTARRGGFPLRAGLKVLVPLHWAFVLAIPAARANPVFAVIATGICAALLYVVLFSPPEKDGDGPGR